MKNISKLFAAVLVLVCVLALTAVSALAIAPYTLTISGIAVEYSASLFCGLLGVASVCAGGAMLIHSNKEDDRSAK
mgnify:CR=1 FL=1